MEAAEEGTLSAKRSTLGERLCCVEAAEEMRWVGGESPPAFGEGRRTSVTLRGRGTRSGEPWCCRWGTCDVACAKATRPFPRGTCRAAAGCSWLNVLFRRRRERDSDSLLAMASASRVRCRDRRATSLASAAACPAPVGRDGWRESSCCMSRDVPRLPEVSRSRGAPTRSLIARLSSPELRYCCHIR